MRRVRQRDTAPEVAVRRILKGMGVGYRLCPKDLPGSPDIANKTQRWAIFVHGCFWHGHEGCRLFRVPKTNSEFWRNKVASNQRRDRRKAEQLRNLGLRVLTVWQCELEDAGLQDRLTSFTRGEVAEMRGGDAAYLRERRRPTYESASDPVTLVDLFAGCGGLTAGVAEACRAVGRGLRVGLAAEHDPVALGIYLANFTPDLGRSPTGVEDWFPGAWGTRPRRREADVARGIGSTDLLVAGPPCQGHSNLNNHTRGDDPRNALYERVVRAAEVLRPRAVLIEQVPSAKRASDQVVERSALRLEKLGYRVTAGKVRLVDLGVPQLRERHVLLASVDGAPLLGQACELGMPGAPRTVRWAIEGLDQVVKRPGLFDTPSRLSPANTERARWLLDHDEYDLPNHLRPACHRDKPDHKYKSMYGRLRWDAPAQTITSGFGSPGQGRYLHPSRPRTLTPHEAARIQFFPDWFAFSGVASREALAKVIGNAVPPKLGYVLARYMLDDLLGLRALESGSQAAS